MRKLLSKSVVVWAGVTSTSVIAHHTEEAHIVPFSHFLEGIALGFALLAMVSLVVLVLRVAR